MMTGILEDKDRIFLNLYGLQDWRLEAAKARGAWNATADMLGMGPALADRPDQELRSARGRWRRGLRDRRWKWSFMPKVVNPDRPHYLVRSTPMRSEPGTCKRPRDHAA